MGSSARIGTGAIAGEEPSTAGTAAGLACGPGSGASLLVSCEGAGVETSGAWGSMTDTAGAGMGAMLISMNGAGAGLSMLFTKGAGIGVSRLSIRGTGAGADAGVTEGSSLCTGSGAGTCKHESL